MVEYFASSIATVIKSITYIKNNLKSTINGILTRC